MASDSAARERRDDLTEDWLMSQRQPSTAVPYRHAITAFFTWCEHRGTDPLTARRRDIDAYRHHLMGSYRSGGPLSPSTTARHLSTISSWYRFGIFEGQLEVNPVLAVKRPVVDADSKTQGLSLDEAAAMLAASVAAGPRTGAVLHLLLSTGARVSEMCAATTSDLGWDDDSARTVRIVRKGGKEARVSVQPILWAPVQHYLEERPKGPDGPLLATERGAMARSTAWRIVSELAAEVVPRKRIHPHSLRHTAATLALDLGQPIQEVQQMLGHKAVATTVRYDRARASRGRAGWRALGQALAGTEDADRG